MSYIHFLFIAFFNISIAVFIYAKNPRRDTNVAFGILLLSCALWVLSLFVFLNSSDYNTSLQWGRFAFTTGMLVPSALLHFVYSFPNNKIAIKKIMIIYGIGFIILVLTLTPLVIKDIKYESWGIAPTPGQAYFVVIVFFVSFLGLAIVHLLRRLNKAQGLERLQLVYISLGLFVPLIHNLFTNMILPLLGFKNIYVLGPWSTIELGLIFGYAILRYRLLDISIVIKRTTIYLVLIGFISSLYAFVVLVPYSMFGKSSGFSSMVILIIAAIIITSTIQPLRNWLDSVTDKIFFQKKYNYEKILGKVSKQLHDVIKLEDAYEAVVDPFVNDMHLKGVGVYLKNKAGDETFACQRRKGKVANDLPELIHENNPVIKYLGQIKTYLDPAEFKYQYSHLYSGEEIKDKEKYEIQQELDRDFAVGMIVPLLLKNSMIGFIVLGEKLSGDQFTHRDLSLLETIASQLVTAMDNIRLYEQMLNNERLTIIGTMSASIAHEIRNPLASIKTFIQMLKNKHNQPEFMKKFNQIVPAEIERIAGITADLLNFSKPSSLSLETVQILDVVDRVVNLLAPQMRKRQIKVEKNIDPELTIKADSQQLFQVVLNIVLNAIQASRPGKMIKISTEVKKEKMNFDELMESVVYINFEDQGEGIREKELENIFEPFFTTKTEGTGLGLATCKRIIESHRGQVFVESEVGVGTKMSVILPMKLTKESLAL